jgi:ectoine hydroxylase-related dioxygenase (phytanoyl-CoA dioxygenase family)
MKSTKDLSERFNRDGYAVVDQLTTAEDVVRIRTLLDPLFERFDSLGDRAFDLAGPTVSGASPKSPEVNEAAVLEPRLRQTETFERCREVARRLLDVPVVGYQFDHAIYKTPKNQTPTAWHQDEAYNQEPIPLHSVHFWIPLQEATVENGCMWFIPGSHHGGRLVHGITNRRGAGGTMAVESLDSSNAVACPLQVGSATVHQPLTLHYTGPNQSDAYRRAWILHFGAYGSIRRLLHPKSIAARLRSWI